MREPYYTGQWEKETLHQPAEREGEKGKIILMVEANCLVDNKNVFFIYSCSHLINP